MKSSFPQLYLSPKYLAIIENITRKNYSDDQLSKRYYLNYDFILENKIAKTRKNFIRLKINTLITQF